MSIPVQAGSVDGGHDYSMFIGPTPTKEQITEYAKRILPNAQELADYLAKVRPTSDQFLSAYAIVLQKCIGAVLSELATHEIIETIDRTLPAAVQKVIEGEWDMHAGGKRYRETLQAMILRKLEDAVQREVAAGYTVHVDVRFERKIPAVQP